MRHTPLIPLAAGLAAAMLALGASISAAAGPLQFVPHRAHYKVSLIEARKGTGIAALDGEMMADFDQSCEGWTLTQTSTFNIYDVGGQMRSSLDAAISTWESADGREYRFSVKNGANGAVIEELEGVARLPTPGGKGWAQFSEPREMRIDLPAGTLFPIRHTVVVMKEIAQAPTIISRMVFDGLSDPGLHQINAVIAPEAHNEPNVAALRGHRVWPTQLAFFEAGSSTPEPEYEIGVDVYDNGVSDRMKIDFGEFKIRADLSRLELKAVPSCK